MNGGLLSWNPEITMQSSSSGGNTTLDPIAECSHVRPGEHSRITRPIHRHINKFSHVLSYEILRWFVIVVGNCHPQLQAETWLPLVALCKSEKKKKSHNNMPLLGRHTFAQTKGVLSSRMQAYARGLRALHKLHAV